MLEVARNKLNGHWDKYVASWFTRDALPSDVPVAILMPLAKKDIARAAQTVQMVRRNLTHPIARIFVAAPDLAEIRAFCERTECTFVDEAQALSDIGNAQTLARMSGWHRQQLLKLLAPRVTGMAETVAIDADTYPLRPVAYLDRANRQILYTLPRDRMPYHRFTERLIGPAPGRRLSFVAHTMLFRQRHLDALYEAISEHTGRPWIEAVLEAVEEGVPTAGVMSEFDLYGHFLLRERRAEIALRPAANLKVSIGRFSGDRPLRRHHRRFRFVSNHQRGD